MVHLRVSNECRDDLHEKCPKGSHSSEKDEVRYGGWRCTCWCHTKKQQQAQPTKKQVESS